MAARQHTPAAAPSLHRVRSLSNGGGGTRSVQEHAVGSLGALRVDRGCREARASATAVTGGASRSAQQEMPRGLPSSTQYSGIGHTVRRTGARGRGRRTRIRRMRTRAMNTGTRTSQSPVRFSRYRMEYSLFTSTWGPASPPGRANPSLW